MPEIPPEYKQQHSNLEQLEIEFDCGGVQLFGLDEISAGQEGYSGEGWSPNWLVIGHDLALGDPFFIDIAAKGLPVYTAMHGAGEWNPELVAASVSDFLRGLRALAELARGRESPVALERHPVTEADLATYRRRIKADLQAPISEFWEGMIPS